MAKFSDSVPFLPLAQLKGIYVARKGNLRCTAVRLKGGSVCLFSPLLATGSAAQESLAEIGPVTHLLAPNHYHHKGLCEYARMFPKAEICASAISTARLRKQTKLEFSGIADLGKQLPRNISFLEPEGLKTGEVWLRVKTSDLVAWIVVDALAGAKMTAKTDRCAVPELLSTFPKFGVQDTEAYISWVEARLKQDQPELVVPCHGSIIAATALPRAISRVMATLI